jgi:hypothetical protein
VNSETPDGQAQSILEDGLVSDIVV